MDLKIKKPHFLAFSLALCLGAGWIGSIFNQSSLSGWYNFLNKPSFNPPNWLFAPVWTILFIMMGIALYLVFLSHDKDKKEAALISFFIQLTLNIGWSFLFFGLRNPMFSFVEILVLFTVIIFNIIFFQRLNKTAAYLLYPYLAWVGFASILNFYILKLNSF